MPDDDDEDLKDPEVVAYFESLPDGRFNPATMPPHIAEKILGGQIQGVRCPKCAWRPRAKMKWGCKCRHLWNTFATRGKCPACSHQWTQTQCSGCHQWSEHEEWYEPLGLPS